MAKNTIAQEVSTGTSESFTEHEMSDPEPHLAILRNRPGLRDEPAPKAETLEVPPVVEPDEVEETETEIEEFQAELDPEPEELVTEEESKPTPRKAAKKTAPRRKTTDDYDFE